ncbi:hypothetical protein [Sphingomonas sp. G-3-2-10]|uniref:hypothetical protein n=1 Tax=Sphingomonas sp. G-3-2-10 TaxID=2728838 RepID=UPI00146AFD99|nr:hypothetical protein [Sphingomonas sp. G-3-2-10]NML08369.1 hypothetical protein [Sphingomonas sp. G-3-2-10]
MQNAKEIISSLFVILIIGGSCSNFGSDPLNDKLDKHEIIGCYKSHDAPDIKLNLENIVSDSNVIYSEYEYGLVGRNNDPVIVVFPRNALIKISDSGGKEFYKFDKYLEEKGRDFSFDVDRSAKGIIITIPSFPDMIMHKYNKVDC